MKQGKIYTHKRWKAIGTIKLKIGLIGLFAFIAASSCFAQKNPVEGKQIFKTGNNVYAIAEEDDFLWVGLGRNEYNGYLVRINKTTGSKTFFHNDNSKLPTAVISSIAIDEKGDKWIGTYGAGLFKYDGKKWSIFTSSNSKLTDDMVMDIAIDDNGQKWIGTKSEEKSGLVKYNNGNWIVYDSLPDNQVQAIAIDNKGNKWIGMDDGLTRFNGKDWKIFIESNSGLPLNDVSNIAIDNAGNKWIGATKQSRNRSSDRHVKGGLVKFDGNNWDVYHNGIPDEIQALSLGDNGYKWIGTKGGLSRFFVNKWRVDDTTDSNLKGQKVLSVSVSGNGNAWIGKNDGLMKYDRSSDKYRKPFQFPLPANGVQAMAIDGNDKWIKNGKNLVNYDGKDWTHYNHSNTNLPPNTELRSLVIDNNGNKWLGTEKGLFRYNGKDWKTFKKSNSGLPANDITSLANDNKGNLWIGTFSGEIVKYDGKDWKVYNDTNSKKPDGRVTSLAFDKEGTLWMELAHRGVAKYNGKKWKVYNRSNSRLQHNSVDITIDKQDIVWIEKRKNVVKLNTKKEEMKTILDGPKFFNTSVTELAVDNKNTKWLITTENKLIKYKNGKSKTYDLKGKGLPSGGINFIKFDKNKRMWIGATGGLVKLKIK